MTPSARVEKGDPSVSFGTYATVIFILGLLDLSCDVIGKQLAEEQLPNNHPTIQSKQTKIECLFFRM
jgi:hypothetical protein